VTSSTRSEPTIGPRVYVDARIEGRHRTDIPKTTAVGFVVNGRSELDNARVLEASESDEAELHAVVFAIRELKDKLSEFTIVCDHDSVVSIINRESEKAARKRPILLTIFNEKRGHPNIKFEGLEKNPTHKFLKRWMKEHQISK
jgi:ribonuclease HI